MTSLVRVELRRILARKIVPLSILAIIAVAALSFWGMWQTVQPQSAFEERARSDFQQAHESWEREQEFQQENLEQCLADQESEREASGDPTLDFGCEWPEPVFADFIEGYTAPPMSATITNMLKETSAVVLFLVVLGGSTATAAELSHRTMGTWLTFEPRRTRVFASKTAAAGLAATPVVAVYLLLFLLGIPLLYQVRGVADAMTGAQWSDVSWMSLRITALAVVLGIVGAAAGILLKHTGAVLGIAVGYFLVLENMVRGLFPKYLPYLLSENIQAWIKDGHDISTWVCDDQTYECKEVITHITLQHGATVVGIVAVVVVLVSWLVFRRRDVD